MKTVEINKLVRLDFQGREAYKTLRSNIQFCGSDIKIIGLTSCIPNEGKSSVSLNLAISMAEAGKKTVFVDADLRKSVLVGRYRINQSLRGLAHYLSGINSKDDIIYQSNIDNLYMIFSGPVPPNPSELLGGEKFTDLIKKLSEEYDYVIIDTPPLGSVIDSAVIAKVCNGMILVIEANNISYKFAQKVKQQLEMTGCPILGAVLNKVDISEKGYGKYYGKYYGHEYGKETN
ncbi:CpsD/CapB family tyrosine-protein kinase [Herbinix luporum]|jgi:capsular exopolysaccharide synthesis family protein|uniref:CpsD/CapB family tyrosine-protein kinase n=1 Tax=Herbinix luporum TaxID=1679721 RepID=UPI00176A9DC8|nr:CpsD/CapB family tyrosine-protein kinase [Herbinix luporum]MDI9489512.1 CpsD/CapB family tyrosine-protein kinase [Bacillota bacterium]HHT57147.1 CpsD/CapB family tyrosine-protein kinase [Herbinix luporum]